MEREEFPEKPYHEILEKNKAADEIVDLDFKKNTTAFEGTITLEPCEKTRTVEFCITIRPIP